MPKRKNYKVPGIGGVIANALKETDRSTSSTNANALRTMDTSKTSMPIRLEIHA